MVARPLEERRARDIIRAAAKAKAPKPKGERKAKDAWARPVLPPRPKLTEAQKITVHARFHGLCGCGCGEPVPVSGPEVQYDHILPRALGGSDELDNYQPLRTVPCHARKTADDLARIRKADRQGKAGEKNTGRKIQSAGFDHVYRPMARNRGLR